MDHLKGFFQGRHPVNADMERFTENVDHAADALKALGPKGMAAAAAIQLTTGAFRSYTAFLAKALSVSNPNLLGASKGASDLRLASMGANSEYYRRWSEVDQLAAEMHDIFKKGGIENSSFFDRFMYEFLNFAGIDRLAAWWQYTFSGERPSKKLISMEGLPQPTVHRSGLDWYETAAQRALAVGAGTFEAEILERQLRALDQVIGLLSSINQKTGRGNVYLPFS